MLVEALPRIGDRRIGAGYTLEQALLDRWAGGQTDRRTWNLSRSTAHRLVEFHAESAAVGAPNVNRR